MTMTIEITTEVRIEEQKIKDLLCCAFEGGSNYWIGKIKYTNPNDIEVNHGYVDLPFIEGCCVTVYDTEYDEEEGKYKGVLNKESIQSGMQILADKYPHHWKDINQDNEDANTGDAYLQCCLFGEVVFE